MIGIVGNDSIQRIRGELAGLGYEPVVFESPQGMAVGFDYTIPIGSHVGTRVSIAVSMMWDCLYPEYPPHWLHVSPPIDDGRGGARTRYTDPQGREWLAMSRPPSDFWDRLPTKHMQGYIRDHLPRIWKDI